MTRPYALGKRKLPMVKEDEAKIHACGHEDKVRISAIRTGEHSTVECLECGFKVTLTDVMIDYSRMAYGELLRALDGSGRG